MCVKSKEETEEVVSYDPKHEVGTSNVGSFLKVLVGGAALVAGASYLGVTFYKKVQQGSPEAEKTSVPLGDGEKKSVHPLSDPSKLYSGLVKQ